MKDLANGIPRRLDGVAKVTGLAGYAGDARTPPGTLHAALVLSSIASGSVVSINADAALRGSNCVVVLSHENALRVRAGAYRTWLQSAAITHAGQPVAMVLAETSSAALMAAELVEVDYASDAPLPRLGHPDAEPRTAPHVYGEPSESLRGDLDAGRAKAAVTIDAEYSSPAHCHNPVERGVVLAEWREGKVFVQTATSGIFAARRTIAQALEIQEDAVVVQMPFQGGGFGAKGSAWWPSLLLAVSAARQLGRPVRLELSREEMFSLVGRRAPTWQSVSMGADSTGRLSFIDHLAVQETSPLADYSDPTCFATRNIYACPNVRTNHRLVTTNAPQPNAMRAPGETPGSFALESAIDELCHRLGADPVAFRLSNIAARDEHSDREWSSNSLGACLEEGARRFGWVPRPPNSATSTSGVGQGVSAAYYPVHQAAAAARVRLDRQGQLTLFCGNQDIGNGSLTVMAQAAAKEFGVHISNVAVEYGDTRLPEAPMAAGSMGTASVIPAIQGAARALKTKIIRIACDRAASALAGSFEDNIVWHSPADIRLAGTMMKISALDLLGSAPHWEAEYVTSPSPTKMRGMAFGACFAQVSVDVELGLVRLLQVTGVYAAGQILNRQLAESQLIGGIVMGVGAALTEKVDEDPVTGLPLNRSLGSYLVPTNSDVGAIDIHLLAEQDRNTSTNGIKGLGMIGSVGVTAAITNAVFDATGLRIRNLPIAIDKILTAARCGNSSAIAVSF